MRRWSIDPRLAGKARRHDDDIEVRLAAGPGPGMASMALGIVDDFQMARLQRLDQLGADALGHSANPFSLTATTCSAARERIGPHLVKGSGRVG